MKRAVLQFICDVATLSLGLATTLRVWHSDDWLSGGALVGMSIYAFARAEMGRR